jgi:hypothetical protein
VLRSRQLFRRTLIWRSCSYSQSVGLPSFLPRISLQLLFHRLSGRLKTRPNPKTVSLPIATLIQCAKSRAKALKCQTRSPFWYPTAHHHRRSRSPLTEAVHAKVCRFTVLSATSLCPSHAHTSERMVSRYHYLTESFIRRRLHRQA